MKKINIKTLIISIIIPLFIGILGSLFSNSGSAYKMMIRPPLSPPGFIFPIVWSILYILMGISSYRIYESDCIEKESALFIYIIQLVLNSLWTVVFFNLRLYFLAIIWVIALIILVIIMIKKFHRIDKLAGYLQIPYLAWLLFALYLTIGVYTLN